MEEQLTITLSGNGLDVTLWSKLASTVQTLVLKQVLWLQLLLLMLTTAGGVTDLTATATPGIYAGDCWLR